MKILLLSDIHDDYVPAQSGYVLEKPDFVLDCGDHTEIKNLFDFTPHFYVYGNHEPSLIKLSENDMPLPSKLEPGQVVCFEKGECKVRVAGIDGNYANKSKPYRVDFNGIEGLERLAEGEVDILLTHESPLLILEGSNHKNLADKVISEIDRIKPKYVFSGHAGFYRELKTPSGIKNIVIEGISRGYCLLDGESYEVERRVLRFR